jgi:predicted lysophospholipase L1 biosynthesis ABC-type transport system permease subunit
MTTATSCVDGDVFGWADTSSTITRGSRLATVIRSLNPPGLRVVGHWRVPSAVHLVDPPPGLGMFQPSLLLVTPAALRGVALPQVNRWSTEVDLDPRKPDAVEYLRNAVAAHPLRANVETMTMPTNLNEDQKTFGQIRKALLAGSLFTLALAGISMLVLALEQVRERRRPLAMLSASGVPRAVLARSLLWQVAVPVVLGVLAAIVTGVGLALLVLNLTSTPILLDWADVGVFSAAAVLLVLLVTAATLPALRNATRLAALRTE